MTRRLIVDDGRQRRELLLVGRMLVGRDPKCEISHGDPRLSRRHAEFEVTPAGVCVRDLQSRNGIRVNGAPVEQALLKPGDSVQIAHLVLHFTEGDADALASSGTGPVVMSRLSMPLAVTEAIPDDDRTRAIAASNAVRAGLSVREEVADDRTRVTRPPSSPPPATKAAKAAPAPMDLGDLTIVRDAGVAVAARTEPEPDYLGVQWLAARGWGRRVLLQGLLLALVVSAITSIPLLAWQTRTFGVTAVASFAVLVPALLAAAFAGVMVASLIARTTARGLEKRR
jgi:hypothetical protein